MTFPTFAVAVLTCPREQPTLSRTLDSLSAAGWQRDEILVSRDDRRAGCYLHWRAVLGLLLVRSPQADFLLVSEDDAIYPVGLREWLSSHRNPNRPDPLAWNSLYCAAPNELSAPASTPVCDPACGRWLPIRVPKRAYGALSYLITPALARRFLANPPLPGWRDGTDRAAGVFCKREGIRYCCHLPSFVRHIGDVSSLRERRGGIDEYRRAATWVTDCRGGRLVVEKDH
jgi:hypothetical protein